MHSHALDDIVKEFDVSAKLAFDGGGYCDPVSHSVSRKSAHSSPGPRPPNFLPTGPSAVLGPVVPLPAGRIGSCGTFLDGGTDTLQRAGADQALLPVPTGPSYISSILTTQLVLSLASMVNWPLLMPQFVGDAPISAQRVCLCGSLFQICFVVSGTAQACFQLFILHLLNSDHPVGVIIDLCDASATVNAPVGWRRSNFWGVTCLPVWGPSFKCVVLYFITYRCKIFICICNCAYIIGKLHCTLYLSITQDNKI